NFLWFNLSQPDIWITVIAGILYFLQAFVLRMSMPNEQRQMRYMMMIIIPIMIVWISLSSASALGFYWAVCASFLIVHMQVANMYYSNLAKKEVAPMIEAMKNNNSEKASKGKNTQVAPKKSKKK